MNLTQYFQFFDLCVHIVDDSTPTTTPILILDYFFQKVTKSSRNPYMVMTITSKPGMLFYLLSMMPVQHTSKSFQMIGST